MPREINEIELFEPLDTWTIYLTAGRVLGAAGRAWVLARYVAALLRHSVNLRPPISRTSSS